MTPQVLFEDTSLLVLSKPSKLHSVGQLESNSPSLAQIIGEQYPELVNASEKKEDFGLVNRLDFETSGLVLVAKTRDIWTKLREQIQRGEIHKEYLALADGIFDDNREISTFIGNPNRGAPKVRVFAEKPRKKDRALPAKSLFAPYKILKDKQATIIQVIAPTARRHQIRAHAAFVGHPLIGDTQYGSTRSVGDVVVGREERFLLHAGLMRLVHPVTGKEVSVAVKAEWEVALQ